jgi:hypothetical protein
LIEKNPGLIDFSPGSLAVYLFGLSLYEPDARNRPQPTEVVYGFGGANLNHLPNNIVEVRSRYLLLRPGAKNSLYWHAHRAVEEAMGWYKRNIRPAK